MKQHLRHTFRKIVPFIISAVLIFVLIGYAPWGEVAKIFAKISVANILLLVGLSLAYYFSKAYRFWHLLRAMKIKQPFLIVAMSYISAQPAGILPGGEVFRSYALEKQTGVPVKKSIAQFTIQGLLEGAGLATVMIISAIALDAVRIPAIILGIAVIAGFIALNKGYMVHFLRYINRLLPFIHVKEKDIVHFNERHQDVLNRRWLPPMYALSLSTELIGTAIAYVSVNALGGDLNVFQAGLMYTIPIIVGFLSLLPGGFGLSEQSSIGILLLSNITTGLAVASTLLMRATIVGLGIVFGCIALLIGQLRLRRLPQPILDIADAIYTVK